MERDRNILDPSESFAQNATKGRKLSDDVNVTARRRPRSQSSDSSNVQDLDRGFSGSASATLARRSSLGCVDLLDKHSIWRRISDQCLPSLHGVAVLQIDRDGDVPWQTSGHAHQASGEMGSMTRSYFEPRIDLEPCT